MAIDPVLDSEVLTSEEQWRRWNQRGRDSDAAGTPDAADCLAWSDARDCASGLALALRPCTAYGEAAHAAFRRLPR